MICLIFQYICKCVATHRGNVLSCSVFSLLLMTVMAFCSLFWIVLEILANIILVFVQAGWITERREYIRKIALWSKSFMEWNLSCLNHYTVGLSRLLYMVWFDINRNGFTIFWRILDCVVCISFFIYLWNLQQGWNVKREMEGHEMNCR